MYTEIPLPPSQEGRHKSKYPWADMVVGQEVFIMFIEEDLGCDYETWVKRVRQSAIGEARRHGTAFKVRRRPGGVCCTRKA